jgi:hypothetical protein
VALTEGQLVDIRRQVGNAPDDAALNLIYDRVESVDELVLEVLEIRYADMLRNPASYSISGKYSETKSAEQLKGLLAKISSLRAKLGLDPVDEGSVMGIVHAVAQDPR